VVIIGTLAVSVPIGRQQASWIHASQVRVAETSTTLGSIKWLRLSGLNDMAFCRLRSLRTHELAVSERFRYLLGVSLILCKLLKDAKKVDVEANYFLTSAICTPIIGPILTLAAFSALAVRAHSIFTISRAFTSVSLILLLNQPLSRVILALPTISSALASFQRVQKFLTSSDRVDTRLDADCGLTSELGAGGTNTPSTWNLSNVTLLDPSMINTSIEPEKEIQAKSPYTDSFSAVASVQGKFSWKGNCEPVIDIGKLELTGQTLILVLGPVGCGKSTLLKAVLGELPLVEGLIERNYKGVAYCDQTPWLPNDTIRNIITAGSEFNEEWYRRVISSCELEMDIASWPMGDQTLVGTKGISMSGGQKQRMVCLSGSVLSTG